MNIVIDQGNTSIKVALFDGHELIDTFRYQSLCMDDVFDLLGRFSPQYGILCSVGEFDKALTEILNQELNLFTELNADTPLPIRIEYKTPQTLGKDRVAAVIGAQIRHKGSNLLVIDAGTAITYDFLNSEGVYKGGNISPGMDIRFKALHQFTKRLPMLDEEGDIPPLGYDTTSAIRAGVVNGIIREMDSYIDEYQKKYNVLTFLTGGHSIYFADKLKNRIFADGNLVLKGLNEILINQYA